MAKLILSVPFLSLVLLLASINSGGMMKLANGQEATWCVAKPSSSDAELVENIHFAIEHIDPNIVKLIQPGGACFYPNTYINHASVVMNAYYQRYGRNNWNCYFQNSGLISIANPSYDTCQYVYA